MMIKDIVKWNKRASIMYAVGVWTFIGSCWYLKYTGRLTDAQVETPEEPKLEEGLERVVYETAHTKTIVIYRKDFIPYTTRIYNFITGGESGDK